MATAMKCNSGIYRVEEEDGRVYIYDSYDELTQDYTILGVITPSAFVKFAVTKKQAAH